jgi:hypothetical protein
MPFGQTENRDGIEQKPNRNNTEFLLFWAALTLAGILIWSLVAYHGPR